MYSLVIADDEQNICDGIAAAVKTALPDIEIIATFFDGTDLLNFLKTSHTDILICDIRMGEVSGVDIAKYIYDHKKETHVILITGYRMFEYAKKAIDYNVDFLLTKPFSSAELIKNIKQIEQQFKTDLQNAINSKKTLINDWNNARRNTQKLFNGELGADDFPLADLPFFRHQDFSVYEICYMIDDSQDENATQKIVEAYVERAIDLGEFSSSKFLCFYCGFAGNEIYFTAFSDGEIDSALISSFITGMSSFCGKSFSSRYIAFRSIKEYAAFCKSRKFFNECISFVPTADNSSWEKYINSKLDKCTESELSSIYKYISESFASDQIQLINDNKDIKENLEAFFSIMHENNSDTKSSSDVLVEKAYEYVIENYGDCNISVYNIANALCSNADYLSRIFKKKTGQGLSSFLLKTRMSKSIELLEKTSMSITEIAAAIGFNDVSYFKRTFKSYNGISPSEYRRIIGK